MSRGLGIAVLAVVVAGTAGWHYRARLTALINPPASAAHPAENPDVLYSWEDKDGVTHFSQQSGKGTRLEYDGSRITPVDTVEAPLIPEEVASEDGKEGQGGLHGLRQDLQESAQRMREAKAATGDL